MTVIGDDHDDDDDINTVQINKYLEQADDDEGQVC